MNRFKSPFAVIPLFIFLAAGPSVMSVQAGENYLYHTVHASVLVSDPAASADKITSWAEGEGGYYLLKSDTEVIIRLPAEKVQDLRGFLDTAAEKVYDYTAQAVDVKNDILFTASAIDSREEILKRNTDYLSRTDVSGTLAIEKEVMAILKELEQLKGRLNQLNQNRKYARVDISLNFMKKSLPRDIPSSFPWINSIDFYSFIEGGVR